MVFPPGQAMGDGSFSRADGRGNPLYWLSLCISGSFQIPVSTADISVGSTRSGYHLSEQQLRDYDQCAIVPREEADPEIWCVFTGTYVSAGAVSHVGIYVGGSRMLHCGSPIGYADLTSPY